MKIKAYAEFAKKGTLFTNYFGLSRPSQPNYIGLIAGDTFQDTFPYGNGDINLPNPLASTANSTIVDLLEAKGLSWKVYIENYPEAGTTDTATFFTYPFGVNSNVVINTDPGKGTYASISSTFGPTIGLPNKQLIYTTNFDGSPQPGQDFTGKIAVIQRGGGFGLPDKALNAQKAGAVGAIVYNSATAVG